jgi:hypothetical protein
VSDPDLDTGRRIDMLIHPHDPNPASAAMAGRSAGLEDTGALDRAFRTLVIRGLSANEAGNVVAYMAGLHPAQGGWTVEEIKRLQDVRARWA